MYVGLGVVVLGFVFWFVLMLTLNITGARWPLESWFLERNIPSGILAFMTLMLCYVAGGYVGDWIGKRRDYRLPLYS